ncbi:MAG TPA: hypothetical protein VE861_05725 [Gemmatimonadaceae bacterium]|nr:hypothetical protein [Gemmatimonadaceae bacterium]
MTLVSATYAMLSGTSVSGVPYGLLSSSLDSPVSSRAGAFVAAALVWMMVMLLCAVRQRMVRERLLKHASAAA